MGAAVVLEVLDTRVSEEELGVVCVTFVVSGEVEEGCDVDVVGEDVVGAGVVFCRVEEGCGVDVAGEVVGGAVVVSRRVEEGRDVGVVGEDVGGAAVVCSVEEGCDVGVATEEPVVVFSLADVSF